MITAGLLVGTLDIAAAFLLAVSNGRDPVRVLQFIASGVFGVAAFSEGWYYPVAGLIFHYCIAMMWTVSFFFVLGRLGSMRLSRVMTGILLGCICWLTMNLVVLPLSNAPAIPFNLLSAITGTAVLIAAIGLPVSFLAARFYAAKDA